MTGEELRARLMAHERSLRWLARKLDVAPSSVWRWSHDVDPVPPARVEQIKRLLPWERSTNV